LKSPGTRSKDRAVADISCDIVVVGAGVLGLCVASELVARRRDVRVVDPGEPNASSVAAGMIAPAAETLLENPRGGVPDVYRASLDLWPALAGRVGIALDLTPAVWIGSGIDGWEADVILRGFDPTREGDRLLLPSDIRLEPAQALAALGRSVGTAVLPHRFTGLEPVPGRWRLLLDDQAITARTLVLANGTAGPVPGLPPSVAAVISHVRPIAGQIGRVSARLTERVLRGPGGYVAPGAGNTTLIGATMVEGQRSPEIDPAASAALIRMAEGLLGHPIDAAIEWRVGVRGASPDGLPMAGPTGEPSIHVALAPRRNGWLLGPMVARVVADGIEGRPRDRYAAALDPLRFSLPAD